MSLTYYECLGWFWPEPFLFHPPNRWKFHFLIHLLGLNAFCFRFFSAPLRTLVYMYILNIYVAVVMSVWTLHHRCVSSLHRLATHTADFATVNAGGLVPARISSLLERKSGGPPSSYCFYGYPKGSWPSSGPFSEKNIVHFSHRRVTKLKNARANFFFFFRNLRSDTKIL